jgi:hypothetical protein
MEDPAIAKLEKDPRPPVDTWAAATRIAKMEIQ